MRYGATFLTVTVACGSCSKSITIISRVEDPQTKTHRPGFAYRETLPLWQLARRLPRATDGLTTRCNGVDAIRERSSRSAQSGKRHHLNTTFWASSASGDTFYRLIGPCKPAGPECTCIMYGSRHHTERVRIFAAIM